MTERARFTTTIDKELMARLEEYLTRKRRETGRKLRLNDLIEEGIHLLLEKDGP